MVEITDEMKGQIQDWRKSLGRMADDNILMKTRLSTMLQENFDISLLPQVENLYSLLLIEEEFITLIRHNLGEVDSLIESDLPKELNKSRLENLWVKLHSQMMTAGIRLTKLKMEFNEFFHQQRRTAPFQAE